MSLLEKLGEGIRKPLENPPLDDEALGNENCDEALGYDTDDEALVYDICGEEPTLPIDPTEPEENAVFWNPPLLATDGKPEPDVKLFW